MAIKTYPHKLHSGKVVRVTIPEDDFETQRMLETWPELLEACEAALNCWVDNAKYPSTDVFNHTVSLLREAINKAKGV